MREKPRLIFKNKVRYYVVANRVEASFYRSTREVKFKFIQRLTNPNGSKQESELDSSAPGTGFSSAGNGTIRHGLDRSFHHKERELEKFVRRIADELERGWREDLYGELILVCDSRLLGVLRPLLSSHVKKRIKHEIHREFVQGSDLEIFGMILNAIEAKKVSRTMD